MIIPIFDARRKNLHRFIYEKNDGEILEVMEDVHVAAEQWAEMLAQKEWPCPLTLIGADAPAFLKFLKKIRGPSSVS